MVPIIGFERSVEFGQRKLTGGKKQPIGTQCYFETNDDHHKQFCSTDRRNPYTHRCFPCRFDSFKRTMPPKQQPSKKTVDKAKAKIVEVG